MLGLEALPGAHHLPSTYVTSLPFTLSHTNPMGAGGQPRNPFCS